MSDETKKSKGKVIPINKRKKPGPRKSSLDKIDGVNLKDLIPPVERVGSKKQPKMDVTRWEPTEADRQAVRMMVASGLRPGDIARVICPTGPISASTVRRKFKQELTDGKLSLIKDVAITAHRMALSGKYPVMTIFWLKCIAGWDDGRRKSLNEYAEEDGKSVAKRLQTAAQAMYNTLPSPKKASSE